ncbi:MAG: cytochrome C [Thermoanaerobaculia bacterium]|nr:MAG: cytochrome C [Thermoanaerobaculia bacterium]
MKRVLILAAMVLLVASAGYAANSVVGSRHDLRAAGGGTPTGSGLLEVCAVCHTPHQAAAANAQDPLWNHSGTLTTAFGVYASSTLNATPTNIGGAPMGSQSVSMLCMSCHDGTISVLAMYNPPNSGAGTVTAVAGRIDAAGLIISNANMGTSLVDDHPINFTYDGALVTADGGLRDPSVPPIAGWLVGGTVQCSSCHNVHDNFYIPFLNTTNTASALCVACHIK